MFQDFRNFSNFFRFMCPVRLNSPGSPESIAPSPFSKFGLLNAFWAWRIQPQRIPYYGAFILNAANVISHIVTPLLSYVYLKLWWNQNRFLFAACSLLDLTSNYSKLWQLTDDPQPRVNIIGSFPCTMIRFWKYLDGLYGMVYWKLPMNPTIWSFSA